LLQRLKGSMSGDASYLNIKETRAVIKIFHARQGLKEIHTIPTKTLGEHAPWYANVKNLVAQV